MKRKSALLAGRKQPIQARSKATVNALVEATAQVLVARGYEGTTTDAIAERAGVSIGSLYQYFPNKESLVAALMRNHVDEIIGTVRVALSRNADASTETLLSSLVRAGIDAHRIDPALHKVLYEQVPRETYPSEALAVSGRLRAIIEGYLSERRPELPKHRLRMVAFVIETTVEAMTHRAVVESPDWLRFGHLEQEAVALLHPYLAETLR